MAYPSSFGDIQDAVIAKLRLDPGLDRQKVKDWINQAYMEACIETEFFAEAQATSKMPPDTSRTGVPAALWKIDYITSTQADGAPWGPLDLVGLDVVLSKRAYGGTITHGAPQMYAYVSGPQPVIEFWPGAAGGEIFTFYGVRLPPILDDPGSVPAIPEPYGSNLLEFGADVQAAEFKQNYVMLSTYQQESLYWLQLFRGFQNSRAGNRVQQLQIDGARPYVHADNSVDFR